MLFVDLIEREFCKLLEIVLAAVFGRIMDEHEIVVGSLQLYVAYSFPRRYDSIIFIFPEFVISVAQFRRKTFSWTFILRSDTGSLVHEQHPILKKSRTRQRPRIPRHGDEHSTFQRPHVHVHTPDFSSNHDTLLG